MPSKRRRVDESREPEGLAFTETAATGDGHFHPGNEGTSVKVSKPTIQSEPSIENSINFEKILVVFK